MRGRRGNKNGSYDGVVARIIIVWDVLNLHDRGLHVEN